MAETGPTVAEMVRAHDWARHISVQLAPEGKRADLLTLFAFDAEIDRVCRSARDPMPGEIRLQWWREALNGERSGESSAHPLANAVIGLVQSHRLPLAAFESYLDAMTFTLYHDAFPDRAAFEGWAGATASAMMQIAAVILDPSAAAKAADASGHGGIARAVAQAISDLPRSRSRGHCYIPADILAACGLDRQGFVEGRDAAAMKRSVDAFAAFGLEHAASFRSAFKGLPQAVKPALLPAFTAAPTLRAATLSPDAAQATVRASNFRQMLSILKAAVVS